MECGGLPPLWGGRGAEGSIDRDNLEVITQLQAIYLEARHGLLEGGVGRRLEPARRAGQLRRGSAGRLRRCDLARAQGATVYLEAADRAAGAGVRCAGEIRADVDGGRVAEVQRVGQRSFADELAIDVKRHGGVVPGGGDVPLLAGRPIVDRNVHVLLRAGRIDADVAERAEDLAALQLVFP